MLCDHIGRVLNGVARLLIGAGLLQNMRREHIADIVGPMRQQPIDRPSTGIGIVDAMPLYCEPPGLIEGRLVIGSTCRAGLHGLDEESGGIRPSP